MCFISCWINQVKDADRVQTLGSLTIPLSRLLSSPDLSLDQWFQLDNSGSASRIYINTVLRVNCRNTCSVILFWNMLFYLVSYFCSCLSLFFISQVLWLDEERIPSEVASSLEAGLSKQLPQHSSPHPSFATEVMERNCDFDFVFPM